MNDTWCNNCSKIGHTFNQCKIPITSFGCIVFRINKITKKREYLMICRRHSIAYLEFVRGKYNLTNLEKIIFEKLEKIKISNKELKIFEDNKKENNINLISLFLKKFDEKKQYKNINNKNYIEKENIYNIILSYFLEDDSITELKYLLQQMTNKEKELIKCGDFNKIWKKTWEYDNIKLKKLNNEEKYGYMKYNKLLFLMEYLFINIINEIIKNDENIKELLIKELNKEGIILNEYLENDKYLFKKNNLKLDIKLDSNIIFTELIKYSLSDDNIIFNYISKTYKKEFELFPKNGWETPEWGFPKGRKEYKENDYNCAMREFYEETGINIRLLHQITNILPFEENFMGSNYKTYKHKYYLMYMDYDDSLLESKYQKSEVSNISWKTVDECIDCIRPYNIEKKTVIYNIDNILKNYLIY